MTAAIFSRKSIPLFCACLVTALSLASPCSAGDALELVIENSPDRIPEGVIRADLHGVSVVTTSPIFLESTSSGVTIPTDVVVAAVKAAPQLRKALKLYDDPAKITFDDIAIAKRTMETAAVTIDRSSSESVRGVYCGIPKEKGKGSWDNLSCDDSARYSLESVTRLLAFGGLDTSNIVMHKVGVNDVSFVPVRPDYAGALITGNEAIGRLKSERSFSGGQILDKDGWYDLDKIINTTHDTNVIKAAFLGDKSVTFGEPYIETSAEAKLKLPKRIADKFDVYLLHLAMTWRELPHYQLDELNYSVIMPNDTIALALAPLRYGIKINDTTKSQLSPSVEVDGAKVELGEMYGREISFTYIKPTIQAYGLQESRISWSLRDQAVQPGAEQFLCAVGVPKHSKQLNLIMSASVHWLGAFAVAGGIETTDQILRAIALQ
jgi:hypothetical protein